MTEPEIRKKVAELMARPGISPEFSFLSLADTQVLLDEHTHQRAVLNVIQAEAGKHCDERLRGWERWQKVYDWTKEALAEAPAMSTGDGIAVALSRAEAQAINGWIDPDGACTDRAQSELIWAVQEKLKRVLK